MICSCAGLAFEFVAMPCAPRGHSIVFRQSAASPANAAKIACDGPVDASGARMTLTHRGVHQNDPQLTVFAVWIHKVRLATIVSRATKFRKVGGEGVAWYAS